MKTKITNYLSRLLFSDKEESFLILVCMDFTSLIEKERILEYMNTMVEKNPILKQHAIQTGNTLHFEDVTDFDLSKQYEIIEKEQSQFDNETQLELNRGFETKLQWRVFWYQDSKENKQRLIFKIHHGYADGYKIIEMLTSPFETEKLYDKFKRTTTLLDSLYYIVYGTLFLLFMNIEFVLKILFSPKKPVALQSQNEILRCKPISLEKVKKITKEKRVTINDFFYTVMARADYLYHQVDRDILTITPMNISQKEATNNVLSIFMKLWNGEHPSFLLYKVHELFNGFKYSLFIPFLNLIFRLLFAVVPLNIISWVYNLFLEQADYVYTNVMGPSRKHMLPEIEKMSFVVKAKDNEIVYNILSYEGVIQICLSFREGTIQDKKRFEQCIYKAYEELTS